MVPILKQPLAKCWAIVKAPFAKYSCFRYQNPAIVCYNENIFSDSIYHIMLFQCLHEINVFTVYCLLLYLSYFLISLLCGHVPASVCHIYHTFSYVPLLSVVIFQPLFVIFIILSHTFLGEVMFQPLFVLPTSPSSPK